MKTRKIKRVLALCVSLVMLMELIPTTLVAKAEDQGTLISVDTGTIDTVTQDANGARIEFLGGSLRMDYEDYDKTSLRFGYKIQLPEGATLVRWSWQCTTANPDKILYRKGENCTVNEDGTINANLVITRIPKAYFEQELTAKLKITYTLSEGTECTLEEDVFRSRSVKQVVENILASSEATQAEKDYATNLFKTSIDNDVYEDDFFD